MIQISLYNLFIYTGIAHGLFCTGMLFLGLPKPNKQYRMLGLVLAAITMTLIELWVIDNKNLTLPHHLKGVFLATPFLIGPAFYLYTKQLIGLPANRVQQVVHVLPFTLMMLSLLVTHLCFPQDFHLLSAQITVSIMARLWAYTFISLQFVSLLGYLLVVLRRLSQYRQTLRQQYSDLQGLELNWLSLVDYTFLLLISFIILLVGADLIGYRVGLRPAQIFSLCLVLILYALSVLGWRQPTIQREEDKTQNTYSKSGISPSEIPDLLAGLEGLMAKKQLYLQPGLSLNQLAGFMGVRTQQLSQLLNQELKQNFYDYINRYRIEFAKQRLIENDQASAILDVCFSSGFNNKATFNSAFRKFTGMTPTQFRQLATANKTV